jgi:aminopeptidase YwaD
MFYRLIPIIILIFRANIFMYSQDSAFTRFIVNKLASPEFKGRGYVENGDLDAALFVEEEMMKLNIESISKSYLQPFEVSVNTFPGEIFLALNKDTLVPGKDFVVDASSPSCEGKFDVVKITRDELLDRDILAKTIRSADGKFILIDESAELKETKDEKEKADAILNELKTNGKIRCMGIIEYVSSKINWDASQVQSLRPDILVNRKMNLKTLKKVDVKIESSLIRKYKTNNVIGIVRGIHVPDSFIVLTAHYDHLGKMGSRVYFPGANDNASGVAMLLSLGKYFAVNKPKYSIMLIAFGGEELGLLGSMHYAKHPYYPLDKIKFLINFDLAGTGEEGIRVVNGTVYKDKFDFLVKTNDEIKLLPKVDIRGEACNSDHCPFYRAGVPCFYIYTQGGIRAYHDIYDRPETLPLTEFSDYERLMITFIKAL